MFSSSELKAGFHMIATNSTITVIAGNHFLAIVPQVPARGGERVDRSLPLGFLQCYNMSKIFYSVKACDVLYKLRYILWDGTLLGASDVIQEGRHLDF